jgi:tetratricopeptide (TPR) repeat protein
MSSRCLRCGSIYSAYSCPRCAQDKRHRETLTQARELAEARADRDREWQEEFSETTRRLSEEADARIEALSSDIQYAFREAQRETAEAFRTVIAHADVLQAQTKFESGKQLLAAGMHDEALVTFAKAIELDPTFSAAYLFAAHLHLLNQDKSAAATHLEKAFRLLRVRPQDLEAEGWFEIICQFEEILRLDERLMSLLTNALDSRLQTLQPYLPLLRALNGVRLQPLAKKYSARLARFVSGSDAVALLDEMCAGQLTTEASDTALQFAGDCSDFSWKLFFWLYRRGITRGSNDEAQLRRWLAEIPLARRKVVAEAMRLPFFKNSAPEARESAQRIIIDHYSSTWARRMLEGMERQLTTARGIHESRLGVAEMILNEVRTERGTWGTFWNGDPFRGVVTRAEEIKAIEEHKSSGFLKRLFGA